MRIDETCMQCGCTSRRFPAGQEAFARRVAQLVASSTRVSASLLANLPWGIAPHADPSTHDARLPLAPHRLLADMRNQWIVMIGDSTQRMIYDQFNAMLDTYGASCLTILPHVDGNPVLNRDSQKDTDTVCLHPTLPSNRTTAPPFCRAALDWTNPRWPSTRVSMRFLRGLDLGKLELNARDWTQRAHYIEWLERSKWHPASVLFGSDPADAHPVSRAHFVRRNESGPTVVLLHSCAWDTPMINRSKSYYMGMENCPMLPAYIDVKTRTSRGIELRPAPVLQTPCRKPLVCGEMWWQLWPCHLVTGTSQLGHCRLVAPMYASVAVVDGPCASVASGRQQCWQCGQRSPRVPPPPPCSVVTSARAEARSHLGQWTRSSTGMDASSTNWRKRSYSS